MADVINSDDLAFLEAVRDLGVKGRTQQEIAQELGETLSGLRYRLAQLGFRFRTANNICAVRTGENLDEMVSAGALVATPDAPRPTRRRCASSPLLVA